MRGEQGQRARDGAQGLGQVVRDGEREGLEVATKQNGLVGQRSHCEQLLRYASHTPRLRSHVPGASRVLGPHLGLVRSASAPLWTSSRGRCHADLVTLWEAPVS